MIEKQYSEMSLLQILKGTEPGVHIRYLWIECIVLSLVPLGTTEMFERVVEIEPRGNRALLVHSLAVSANDTHQN